jgi:hypothetical protein
MLGEYFSIVRRRADWASRVKLSASFITTTTHGKISFLITGGTLEAVFCGRVNLRGLCNVLEELLNYDTVKVPDIPA